MLPRDGTDFFVRTPGRAPRPSGRTSFWRRIFVRPSAFGAIVLVSALAVIVAFVATLVYATVDAGRPIAGGPTTAQRPQGPAGSPLLPIEPRPSTTRAPENLSPDQLTKKLSASMRTVRTLDESGQPVEGEAFVVGSFGGQTLLLTSLALVQASTRAPAPPITLGDNRQPTLWTWDEGRDLALLVISGAIESLPWADSTSAAKPGDRIFTLSRGRLSTGSVLAVSSTGIEHNIVVEGPLQGAPIVNQKGEVLGMASLAYNPDGRGTDRVFTAVPIALACERVLRCAAGNTDASGAATTTTSRP